MAGLRISVAAPLWGLLVQADLGRSGREGSVAYVALERLGIAARVLSELVKSQRLG